MDSKETTSIDTAKTQVERKSTVSIVPVTTKKQQREFVDFPVKLYRGNPCFVPAIYSEEMKIFRKDFVYNETCESVFYCAYRDGAMVGRIQGILQKASNELRNERRVRFTRFDLIDDIEVARALLSAVEEWAQSLGMNTVFGPLSYSDFEPEGMLVEGFDQLSTFAETYNAEYYKTLVEACGYEKEVDWLEHQVRVPEKTSFDLDKTLDFLVKQSGLHFSSCSNMDEFVDKYKDAFFDLVDDTYDVLYQTVPFTPSMRSELANGMKAIVNKRYIAVLLDKNEKPVAFGLAFPSIVKILQKSDGHLTPLTLIRLLKEVNHPTGLEFGLIGVLPEHHNTGAGAIILLESMRRMKEDGIPFAETNLNLETNTAILAQWKSFDTIQHKRRRAYIKRLDD